MLKQSNKAIDILKRLLPYIICGLLILLSVTRLLSLNERSLSVPFIYDGGDSAVTFYRTFEMKTDHALFDFNQLGSPYGSSTYDFYVFDIGLYIIQFVIAVLSPNYVVAFNVFLIGGAWFDGFASLYALRRLKFSTPLAISLSVVYAQMCYFYVRYHNHTYLAYYFAAPLAICMAIELYRGEFVCSFKKEERKQTIINLLLLVIIGTTGIYYAVFSCIYFLLVLVLRGMEDLKIKSILPSCKAIGATAFGFFLGVLPPVIYWMKNGVGYMFKMRTGYLWGGEVFGVKLTELVLPNVAYRFARIRKIRESYNESFGITEAMAASLGLLFTIGLIIALIYIFRIANTDKKHIMRPVSLLMVASLLIVTKGGLGTFFAMIFPFVRCYNRMCVYIAFLCAISVAWFLTMIYDIIKKKLKGKKALTIALQAVSVVLLAVMMVGGVYEQTFVMGNPEPSIKVAYTEDRDMMLDLVDYAHTLDSDDEMVDVMFFPFMDFPENARDTGGKLWGYEPMMLCAHSEYLAMSYGFPRGREYADKLSELENLTMDEKIDYAIDNGFDGIMIAREAMEAIAPDDIYVLAERFGDPDFYNYRYYYWSLED